MAITFNKLKDPKLDLQDKLTFGKFKDCRICDIIQDHYEYLIWIEKNGYAKFQPIVIETIQDMAQFANWAAPVEDQIKDTYTNFFSADWDNDIPF